MGGLNFCYIGELFPNIIPVQQKKENFKKNLPTAYLLFVPS